LEAQQHQPVVFLASRSNNSNPRTRRNPVFSVVPLLLHKATASSDQRNSNSRTQAAPVCLHNPSNRMQEPVFLVSPNSSKDSRMLAQVYLVNLNNSSSSNSSKVNSSNSLLSTTASSELPSSRHPLSINRRCNRSSSSVTGSRNYGNLRRSHFLLDL
jgi:hypothetical protein